MYLPTNIATMETVIGREDRSPEAHCRECADDGTLTTAALAWLHERGWASVDCHGMYVPLEDDYGAGQDDYMYANER